MEQLAGPGKKVHMYVLDVQDSAALEGVFARHAVDVVVHFAGLKAVGESTAQPLR